MFEQKDISSIHLTLSVGSPREDEFIEKLESLSLSSLKGFKITEVRIYRLIQDLPRLTIAKEDDSFVIHLREGTFGLTMPALPPGRREDEELEITDELISEASSSLSFILGLFFRN